jgi:glycerate kinase
MSSLGSDELLSRYNKSMKFLCAPDSFKGSLSAAAAAAAMAAGALHAAPRLTVLRVPLADGGEGTVDALVGARGGSKVSVDARDPLDRPIQAAIGLLGADTVVIEMAAASGLPLLRPEERDPFRASTYGTGQLLRAALDRGAREIILGVGGSATVDGGAGALQALGARLLDATGTEIPPGNVGLAQLDRLDLRGIDPRLAQVRLRIACDVRNPLTGPTGAAAVFGPQKGARPADIEVLDANLAKLAALLRRATGMDIASVPGAGAAGGLTAGLLAIGAATEPGIELILDATRFDDLLADADLVITGEGRLDRQTAQGKVVSGVVAHAARKKVPVVALAGSVRGGEIGSLYSAGLVAAFPITDGPLSHAKAFARAATLLRRSTESVVRLWMVAAGYRQQ